MNNLGLIKKNVNTSSQEEKGEAIHKILMECVYQFANTKEFFKTIKTEGNKESLAFSLTPHETYKQSCKYNVPVNMTLDPEQLKKTRGKNKQKDKLYPDFYEEFKKPFIPFPIVQKGLKLLTSNYRFLMMNKNNGWKGFLANSKGTPAYMKKMYWKIHDRCAEFDKIFKHCYFITLTMSQKEYGGNFAKAWQDFGKEERLFVKNLKRHFGGAYVIVNESHFSGFPHAHILFYTDAIFNDEVYSKKTKRGGRFMKKGKLLDYCRKIWTKGFLMIDKNRRKDTSNYLSKYIAKVTEAGLDTLSESNSWSKAQRKEVLTVLLPTVYNIRGFDMSRTKKDKNNAEEAGSLSGKTIKKIYRNLKMPYSTARNTRTAAAIHSEWSEKEWRLAATYLKTLCNNSPLPCATPIFAASKGYVERKLGAKITDFDSQNETKKGNIAKECSRMTCKGCILSEMLNFMLAGKSEIFEEQHNLSHFVKLISKKTFEKIFKSYEWNIYDALYKDNVISWQRLGINDMSIFSKEERERVLRVVSYAHKALWRLLLTSKEMLLAERFEIKTFMEYQKEYLDKNYADILDIFNHILDKHLV